MSTDITIEAVPDTRLSFDDFASRSLHRLGQAIQIVAKDPELADAALSHGVQSVFINWTRQRSFEEAERTVFREAVRYCGEFATAPNTTSEDATPPVSATEGGEVDVLADAIAVHVFGWSNYVDPAPTDLVNERRTGTLGHATDSEHIREQVLAAEPAQVNLQTITGTSAASTRRRTVTIALASIAALLTLGALAQFVANPQRTEQAQDTPPIVGVPLERPSFPGENMELEPWVPPAEREAAPPIISAYGPQGFVGMRPPVPPESTVVFLTSTDGRTWTRAGSWDMGSAAPVDRLERMGDRVVVWSESPDRRDSRSPRLAMSSDLQTWTIIDLPALEPQPFGLIYQSRVADLLVREETVVARVSTDVAIDFAALSLSEGYTCGQSITDAAVTVNLCNSQLDVLSFSNVEKLPAPNRLFLSREGQPFEATSEPFGRETAARLFLTDDSFVIADETGVAFATSDDARTWQATSARKPPFVVTMSATNNAGQVLGTGKTASGDPMLFFNNGPNTTSTLLSQIVADASADATVLVASGPGKWVVYVHEPDGRAWIAASSNGLDWNVADADPPTIDGMQLIAGERHALLHVNGTDGVSTTTVIPLP